MDAKGSATLVTKPIMFEGRRLLVNFNAQEGGHVRVAMLDDNGRACKGFDLDDCAKLTGDEVAKRVEWKSVSDDDLAKLSGKRVRLMFEVNKAQLWSFRFTK
jgi:hypothetical protein